MTYRNSQIMAGCPVEFGRGICRRAIEPRAWTLPVGYLEGGETMLLADSGIVIEFPEVRVV